MNYYYRCDVAILHCDVHQYYWYLESRCLHFIIIHTTYKMQCLCYNGDIVRCRYDEVNFQNSHIRHPISSPVRVSYGMSVQGLKSDLSYVAVITALY